MDKYNVEAASGHMCERNGCLKLATHRLAQVGGPRVVYLCDDHLGMVEQLAAAWAKTESP